MISKGKPKGKDSKEKLEAKITKEKPNERKLKKNQQQM